MVRLSQFSRLPLILFGPGRISLLPDLVRKYGESVILVTGKSSFTASERYGFLLDSLRKTGITVHSCIIPGEPSPAMIDSATRAFSAFKIDSVVAVGGGSVMDAGKAISAMMYRQESVKVFLEGVGDRDHPGTKLPFIAVPTTSGTGSEATKNAVISDPAVNGFKKSLRHDDFVPDIALVDPELTISCPPDITAASGLDCFTQLTEAFLSGKSDELTEALAIEGLKAVRDWLVASYANGENIEARTGMSFAALTSGICLANAGLGVVHGFASSVGGLIDIPHGVLCGSLMAPANRVTVKNLRDSGKNPGALKKYSRLGRLFIGDEGMSDEHYIDGFIGYLEKLSDDLNLPRLGRFGIGIETIDQICRMTELKNNPADLSLEELTVIIKDRI